MQTIKLSHIARIYVLKHMQAVEKWTEGGPVHEWIDSDGVRCVRFESGNWYHYAMAKNGLEWW